MTHPFIQFYDTEIAPKLGIRSSTFRAALEALLDTKSKDLVIVETGCLRVADNWKGDGQSTRIFDAVVNMVGGTVWTVDIDPNSLNVARFLVSNKTTCTEMDSVSYLRRFPANIDLLYLDSLDYEDSSPEESAQHQMCELFAALPKLNYGCIVFVDDTFRDAGDGKIKGKGVLTSEIMRKMGCPLIAEHYQMVWKFTRWWA